MMETPTIPTTPTTPRLLLAQFEALSLDDCKQLVHQMSVGQLEQLLGEVMSEGSWPSLSRWPTISHWSPSFPHTSGALVCSIVRRFQQLAPVPWDVVFPAPPGPQWSTSDMEEVAAIAWELAAEVGRVVPWNEMVFGIAALFGDAPLELSDACMLLSRLVGMRRVSLVPPREGRA